MRGLNSFDSVILVRVGSQLLRGWHDTRSWCGAPHGLDAARHRFRCCGGWAR